MMDNLSPFQERILDKLYGPLGPTDNKNELDRVCLIYRQLIETLDDKFIHEKFHEIVGHKLYRVLKQKEEFYYLDRFKIHYKQLSEDFVLENIDATETDFIHKYLDSQKEIIDKTFTYIVKVNSYPSLEVVQFVEKDFFYEFILSSRKKIKFLEEKLKKISSLESEKKNTITKNPQQLGIDKSKNDASEVKKDGSEPISDNPYPLLFVSGEIYEKFVSFTHKPMVNYYLEISYLKKRMEHESFIHRIKDNDFMKIIFQEMKLISKKDHADYLIKNKLTSLNKSATENRENHFNHIFLD